MRFQLLCAARIIPVVTFFVSFATHLQAQSEAEWKPLFNGRDLSGWTPANVAPSTFTVRDGMIVCTGLPVGMLRTERMYENFELELEWRHMKSGGNSGVFVWASGEAQVGSPFLHGIEVQVLDLGYNANGKNGWYTTHGDIFPVGSTKMTPFGRIGGARSFPIEDRTKASPEWNHYRLVANEGEIRLSVNGREVTVGKETSPRKGYLCLESEGSEIHFKNIRLRELPGGKATPDQTRPEALGLNPLFNGVNFEGWKLPETHKAHWKVGGENGTLLHDGKGEGPDPHLWTAKNYKDFVLQVDWRWKDKPAKGQAPVINPDGTYQLDGDGRRVTATTETKGDSGIYLRGSGKAQVNIWGWPVGSGEIFGYRDDAQMPLAVRTACTPKVRADKPVGQWNRFLITVKGDEVKVILNGQTVVDHAKLPGLPASGPIALEHQGSAIEFANIAIREL